MREQPYDPAWLSEARMLKACGLPRSTFQSWARSGLDFADAGGAYGHEDVVALLLLVEARNYLNVEQLIVAWQEYARRPADATLIDRARLLEEGGRFDLVIEPDHASIEVVTTDAELIAAVRHPMAPRPIVVLDLAERIRLVSRAFHRLAQRGPRPRSKRRGRPKRQVGAGADRLAAEIES